MNETIGKTRVRMLSRRVRMKVFGGARVTVCKRAASSVGYCICDCENVSAKYSIIE